MLYSPFSSQPTPYFLSVSCCSLTPPAQWRVWSMPTGPLGSGLIRMKESTNANSGLLLENWIFKSWRCGPTTDRWPAYCPGIPEDHNILSTTHFLRRTLCSTPNFLPLTTFPSPFSLPHSPQAQFSGSRFSNKEEPAHRPVEFTH